MALVVAPTASSPWAAWLAFGETVARVARGALPPADGEALCAALAPVLTPAAAEAGIPALKAYFVDIPAHRTACAQLDQSLFVHPIAFPGHPVPLGVLLERLSKSGPGPFGTVWLALLDVAAACDPTLDIAAARQYVQQRAADPAPGAAPGMPDTAQIDGILSAVAAAFPGIGDTVQQIIAPIIHGTATPGGAGGDDIVNVMENLQQKLLSPLLSNLGGAGADVAPAVTQILEGFKALNQALNATGPAAAPASSGPTGGDVPM